MDICGGRCNLSGMMDSDDPPRPDTGNNIVHLLTLAERQRMQRREEKALRRNTHPPLINLPPMTKAILLVLIAVHAVLNFAVAPDVRGGIYQHFGFVPAIFTGHLPFVWTAIVTPFSYMLLHGGWMHLAVNGLMLAALGAGVERWMGPWRMLAFFTACGLIAAFAHLALNSGSTDPVIGASGGLSGLFAAVLVMMNQMRARAGMPVARMLPVALLWIVITVVSGMMGMPNDNSIAWAAHVGGFLGGFAVLRLMRIA